MDNATIHLTQADCERATKLCSAVYLKERLTHKDRRFIGWLGIRIETEGKWPAGNSLSADYTHSFLNDQDCGDVTCALCNETAEGTTKDGVSLCESCHTQEVGE